MAKVVRRALDSDGQLVGTFDKNPVLNSMLYDVEFPNGVTKQYAANIIAENVLYQVNSTGRHSHVLEAIIDYQKTNAAVLKDGAFVVSECGRRKLRQTTIGWQFKVTRRDGTRQWIPLKVLKESNPDKVAEFAKA